MRARTEHEVLVRSAISMTTHPASTESASTVSQTESSLVGTWQRNLKKNVRTVIRTAARAGREASNLIMELSRHGIRAAAEMLAEDIRFVLAWRKSGARNNRFDAELGTETGGTVPLFRLTIDSPNIRYGRHYTPTPWQSVRNALDAIHEDTTGFTFVDLGCGKGRVLLLAAHYGFKTVIGVEFAHELVEIARSNCQHLENVEVFVEDAAGFRFPEGRLVVYMFNPFGPPVLQAVIRNLATHRDIAYVIYYNPKHAELFDNDDRFRPHYCHSNTRIWKLVPYAP